MAALEANLAPAARTAAWARDGRRAFLDATRDLGANQGSAANRILPLFAPHPPVVQNSPIWIFFRPPCPYFLTYIAHPYDQSFF